MTYRFMHAIAGDLPGFEEATRALYARDRNRFAGLIESWPPDIREHVQKLAEDVWGRYSASSWHNLLNYAVIEARKREAWKREYPEHIAA